MLPILTARLDFSMSSKDILPRLKYKHYIHFDSRILPQIAQRKGLLKDLSFYPLIHYPQKVRKFMGQQQVEIKNRDIYYASHFDRYKYTHFSVELEAKYESWLAENKLSENIIAYRKLGLRNSHFAKQVFDKIKEVKHAYVYATDITKFFDTLDHKILKQNWQRVLRVEKLPDAQYTVFKTVTKFAYIELTEIQKAIPPETFLSHRISTTEQYRKVLRPLIKKHPLEKGIPQGLPISAILSNVYMIDFDAAILNMVNQYGGFYRRYSDDIVIVLPNTAGVDVNALIDSELAKVRLERSIKKTDDCVIDTEIVNPEINIQYLGFEFDGKTSKIRASSINRYYKKLHARIKIVQLMQAWRRDNRRFLKRFYEGYSHLGKSNFIKYAYDSERILNSNTIRKQVRRHWGIIREKLK